MDRGGVFPASTAIVRCFALALWLLALPAAGQTGKPPADSERGLALARTWCAHCHAVGPGQSQQRADGLPSFVAIANDPRQTPDRLRAFLAKPHGRMPDLNLSPGDREDLIGYLRTLKQSR